MPDERRQFRILYRDFLSRMVDLEVLTAHGEIQKLLGQLAALLAAFSFTLAVVFAPRYVNSGLTHEKLLIAAWGDEEFLIATTIAVVGIFAVIAWNTLLPDRRDTLVLGPLPVRTRTMFLARVAAIATALACSVLAVNIFTGLSFALVVVPDAGFAGLLRSFAAYWITMLAAGLFVFSALLAVQGIAAQLLSYRRFLRVSSFLQLAAFFAILAIYFLTPPLAGVRGLTDPANQRLIAWLPSFWFLGLFQQINGPLHPVFGPLAAQALRNLAVALAIAGSTYALAYFRHMRRIVEEPDIAPGDRARVSARLATLLVHKFLPRPLDRAILLFTARTIARSRQHRLLLAAYGGAGLAIALAYAKSLLYRQSAIPWDHANQPLLVGGLVLLIFSVIGTRAIFALPLALPANWIFRITAVHSPRAYFAAVRKSLVFLTAVPVWCVCAMVYLAIWPGRPALEHLLLLALVGILIVERGLYQFRKIPFACSYLPGSANVNVKAGIYGVVFLLSAEVGTQLEYWTLQRTARYVVLFSILLGLALWMRRRTLEYAASPDTRLQFDDLPAGELFALDLHRDGAWSSNAAYVDAVEPHFDRTLLQRLRPFLYGVLALLAAGAIYEHAGRWRDRRRFPQVGQSFDIGGRSLNISCLGQGAPAVILEGTQSFGGYGWIAMQRQIARFTRVCWYDRAGYGWSDPGPFPNHSDTIARDLHKLLQAAHVPSPYVLAGHAMGAFHVRVYRGYYPNEVAGLVFVDPMNEDTTRSIHNHIETFRPAVVSTARLLGFFGFWRLLAGDAGPPRGGLTESEWITARALLSQTKTVAARISEPPVWISGELARAAGGFGDLPVIVLSSGIPSEDWYTETYNGRLELHAALARKSTAGRQEIVSNSQYMLLDEAPQAVVDAVREVVSNVRKSHAAGLVEHAPSYALR